MSKSIIAPILIAPILASIGDVISNPPEPHPIILNHKDRAKTGVGHKQPKPGKNKPAKGYNPETKAWDK